MLTLTLVVRESVLGEVPVIPVTVTLNGATLVAQVTDRTAPEKLAMQPVGTVPALNVTAPLKPLIELTLTVDVPATVAIVVIAGADNEKSWMVTGTLTEPVTVPLVPVTVTLNGAIPVEQVTDSVAVAVGGTVTLVPITEAVQPAGTRLVTARPTIPENEPVAVTAIVEAPVTVASVVIEAGVEDNVNPPPTVTGTLTMRESVLGAVPVVPVTTTVNDAVGSGLQLTDRVEPVIVAVHPVGSVFVTASVTVPVNPLMFATEIVEVPAVPGVIRLIEAGLELSEKSWTVTKIPTVRVIEPLTP
jgi:hypothetical protein